MELLLKVLSYIVSVELVFLLVYIYIFTYVYIYIYIYTYFRFLTTLRLSRDMAMGKISSV